METNFLKRQIKDTFERMKADDASTCNLIKISEWITFQYIDEDQAEILADYDTEMYKKYK